jgi:dihydrofolate reductase
MVKENKVFIARSLDGFIAGKKGEIDWLDMIPNPEGLDLGYYKFMAGIDALIMGRASFETVMGFGGEWHSSCHRRNRC